MQIGIKITLAVVRLIKRNASIEALDLFIYPQQEVALMSSIIDTDVISLFMPRPND